MNRKTAAAAVLAAGLVLAGCAGHHSSAPPRHSAAAAASSLAANPAVSADAYAAGQLVKPCLAPGATYKSAKACIEAKVPKPKRRALLGCLASAYAHDQGWTTAGYATWKTQGVQPCVKAALR
jgi:hypothetical protein